MLLLQQELFYMNMLDKKLQNKTFNDKKIYDMSKIPAKCDNK